MNASDFYRSLRDQIGAAVQKVAPYKARISEASNGLVKIQTFDSATPLGESYAQLAGLKLNPNDEVAVIDLDGKPFVLGRIKRNLSAKNSVEGALAVESSASDALRVVNPSTNTEVFRVSAIDGSVTTNGVPLQAVDQRAVSSNTSVVASTTNTTTFQTALSYPTWNLPAGTWLLSVVGGIESNHSASTGAIALRLVVGGTATTPTTGYTYNTDWGTTVTAANVTVTSTGNVPIELEYRAAITGTANARNPWFIAVARKTA